MKTPYNLRQHFALLSRSLQNWWARGHSDIHPTNLKVTAFRLGLKNISISNALDNGQEEKVIYIFLLLFAIACYLTVALNSDTRSVAFRLFSLFRESILFLTSYFSVSKWWLVTKWNKSLFFFRSVAAEQRGWSCYFQLSTWPSSLPYTRVTYHITWPRSDRFKMAVD